MEEVDDQKRSQAVPGSSREGAVICPSTEAVWGSRLPSVGMMMRVYRLSEGAAGEKGLVVVAANDSPVDFLLE